MTGYVGPGVHPCLSPEMVELLLYNWYNVHNMGVSKNRGKTPKMDGEKNGKMENPISKWMIWIFSPYFWKHPYAHGCILKGTTLDVRLVTWLNGSDHYPPEV